MGSLDVQDRSLTQSLHAMMMANGEEGEGWPTMINDGYRWFMKMLAADGTI